MDMIQMVKGLTLLLKYGDGPFDAEHDEVYAGDVKHSPEQISMLHKAQMEQMGWSWDERFMCWKTFV